MAGEGLEALDHLRRYGYVMLDPFTAEQIGEINAYLLNEPVFADAHVPQTARNRGVVAPQPRAIAWGAERLCVPTESAIRTPHWLEKGIVLTDLAAAYLNCDPPIAYSINAFWTRPGPTAPYGDIQEFHKDEDDIRFLAMFCFLSDVLCDADGPQDLKGPDGETHTIFGPAGTVFLADTSNFHRGRKPTSHQRGILWFRWGISDRPAANVWDKIKPISAWQLDFRRYPKDPYIRRSIRLLVDDVS